MALGSAFPKHGRGIVMLIAAVSCSGAVDGFITILVDTQSFGQIILPRYAPASAALLIAAGPQNWKGMFVTRRPGLQVSPKA